MTCLRYYPGIRLEGLKKTTITSVRIASILAKIQIEHHLQHYCYNNLLHKTYSKVHTGVTFVGSISYSEWPETRSVLFPVLYNFSLACELERSKKIRGVKLKVHVNF